MTNVLVDATRTGWLRKMGNKRDNWKKRFCILKDNYLFYYKSDKKETETKAKFVRLNGGKVLRAPYEEFKMENVIVIQANIYLGKSNSYYFQTNFDTEANDWLAMLTKVSAKSGGRGGVLFAFCPRFCLVVFCFALF